MTETKERCPWCGGDALYVAYHDHEWGRLAEGDERRLFEFLVLESAQAGLCWITILRKREAYRKAFCNFDARRVAQMTAADVDRLMEGSGAVGNKKQTGIVRNKEQAVIVRNRRKIEAAISNARLFLEIERECGSFETYVRSFLPGGQPVDNHPVTMADVPVTSAAAVSMAKDMKRRGFRFFGPVICYAFLEATGFVNDHLECCLCRKK